MSADLSTSGYGAWAHELIGRYERISFEELHSPVLRFFPPPPARVMDVGAGSGRDAAALAHKGYAVTAVEPTEPLRAYGQSHHPSSIHWIDDMLPALPQVHALGGYFDLILLTAVWMHLDADQQHQAMGSLARLLAPGGCISMSLRHGPVPEGRRMFDVSAEQVALLAKPHGLRPLHEAQAADMQHRPDVTWTFLVLQKPAA